MRVTIEFQDDVCNLPRNFLFSDEGILIEIMFDNGLIAIFSTIPSIFIEYGN
ncbi:hypothetical protein BGLA2_700127 [Burkholderia gladioli]|nr:hypothetical protein BGLA2_700127 [Burkholderia gladioli]